MQVNNDIQRATKCKGHRKQILKKPRSCEKPKVQVTERCSRELSELKDSGSWYSQCRMWHYPVLETEPWHQGLEHELTGPDWCSCQELSSALNADCSATEKKSKPRAISLLSEQLGIRLWLQHKALVGRTWSLEPQTPSTQLMGFWIFRTGLGTTLELSVAFYPRRAEGPSHLLDTKANVLNWEWKFGLLIIKNKKE